MNVVKQLEIREHQGSVYSIAFDGSFLYSAGADSFVTRWNLQTGTQDKFAIKFNAPVYKVSVFENLLFAGLSTGEFHVFDIEKRQELKHFTQHTKAIFSIEINYQKRQLFVGDAEGNLSVWSIDALKLLIYLPLDSGKIRAITFSSDANKVAIGGQDGNIVLFDTGNFNELAKWFAHNDGVCSLYFDEKNSDLIYSGGKDALMKTWVKGEQEVSIPAHNYAVYKIKRLADSILISASRDKSIKLWGNELYPLKKLTIKDGGHSHSVNDLCVLNQYQFASCSDDRRIIVWNFNAHQD